MKYLTSLIALLIIFSCGNQNKLSPEKELPSQTPASVQETALDLDYLLGKFDPQQRDDFSPVGAPYTNKPGMMMRKEAFEDFKRMYQAAQQAGISLRIISSTRTFSQQKAIWEGKWSRFAQEAPDAEQRALKILEYSAMPGVSRHHWGTDIDLNDLNNPSFAPGGQYHKTYEWLLAHAHEYGFCQPYSPKGTGERSSGYNEERWHWSYTPLSKPLLAQYLSVVSDSMITGFKGSDMALRLQVVANYAGGISAACQ